MVASKLRSQPRRLPIPWRSALIPATLILIAALVRIALLERSSWMAEGDEAMTGLLAKHIVEGERPVFLPGQSYMGALQAYEAALLYQVVGMSRVALKLVSLAASLGLVVSTYWLARRLLSPAASVVAGLLAAVPPIYVAANTLKSLGPYTEIMALGNVLLALTVAVAWRATSSAPAARDEHPPVRTGWLLGALAGFSFWLHPIVVCFIATGALVLLIRLRVRALPLLPPALGGLAIGGAPLWIANITGGFPTLRFLAAGHAGDHDVGALALELLHGLLPRVVGLRQPWAETPVWISWVIGAILVLGAVALIVRGRKTHGWALAPSDTPTIFVLMLGAMFLFSGFGQPALDPYGSDSWIADPAGRYVVPLWSVAPLAVGALTELLWQRLQPVRWWAPTIALFVPGLVLAAHVSGYAAADPASVFQSPYWNKLPYRSDALITHLHERRIQHVWMNHWAGFPVMFDAEESIIAADYYDVYVEGGANRFPQHFAALERADRTAYVLVTEEAEPKLEGRLRELGVMFEKTRIGPYVVIEPTSRRVHPSEVTGAIGFEY